MVSLEHWWHLGHSNIQGCKVCNQIHFDFSRSLQRIPEGKALVYNFLLDSNVQSDILRKMG